MPTLPKPLTPSYSPKKRRATNESNYKFYNSLTWRNYSKRNRGICKVCEAENHVRASDVMDHIVPKKQGGSEWNEENHMGMCKPHHESKRGYESHGYCVKTVERPDGLIPADRQEIITKLLGLDKEDDKESLDSNWI